MLETPSPASSQASATASELVPNRLVQPIGVKALYGLAYQETALLAVDPYRGYLLRVDPRTDNATILNPQQADSFERTTGLALWEDTLWFTRDHSVFCCRLDDLTPQAVVTLPYTADGVAVWQNTVYITCRKASSIFIHDRTTGKRVTQFSAPGIGTENVAVWGEYLWVCDQVEQTVYCLDRATGEVLMKVLTPFPTPTGIAVVPGTTPDQGTVWVAYANEEPYVRDDPNSEMPFELTFRDRTFIHPLKFHRRTQNGFCLSNGYLLEMAYVEEIDALDAIQISNLKWHMALPTSTDRQTVRSVEPIGLPFEEILINGQRVARFTFDTLNPHERHIFGWKAVLEVYGIKYLLTPRHVEKCPPLPPSFHEKYLVDDDDLAMDLPIIQAAAQEAVRSETNLLRKVLSIRDYVYDRLSYAVTPAIETPDVVLERGRGSCGEYVGLLLALLRLNGIACRTVGRYKCPPHADQLGAFLEPDFNHVWIEFYIPGYGWLPMESNPDDVQEGGPYPTRFFMGLPWWHVEMGKDVSFEKLVLPEDGPEVRLGDLAINHVRFRILDELNPWEFGTQA
ncbi:MAG TPA: transglutaminase family protein [Trichocoleus sp.]